MALLNLATYGDAKGKGSVDLEYNDQNLRALRILVSNLTSSSIRLTARRTSDGAVQTVLQAPSPTTTTINIPQGWVTAVVSGGDVVTNPPLEVSSLFPG